MTDSDFLTDPEVLQTEDDPGCLLKVVSVLGLGLTVLFLVVGGVIRD
jgi:hypothetical protein